VLVVLDLLVPDRVHVFKLVFQRLKELVLALPVLELLDVEVAGRR
jgi:hypothetical protein